MASAKPRKWRSALSLALALAAAPASAPVYAQQQDIQRALIQRDQQSAEFAAQVRGAQGALDELHARQLQHATQPLSVSPDASRELLDYQRQTMATEREAHILRLPPPVVRSESLKPLPLPGRPAPGVEPIAAPSVGG